MVSTTIDPTSDGTTLEWDTTGGAHYTEVDDAVRDPTVPDGGDLATNIATDTTGRADIIKFSIENVATVADVVIKAYQNTVQGEIDCEVSNDGSNWETAVASTTSGANEWETFTFSGVDWVIDGTLTLYVRFTRRAGGPGDSTIFTLYADVTHSEIGGGGGSRIITGNVFR